MCESHRRHTVVWGCNGFDKQSQYNPAISTKEMGHHSRMIGVILFILRVKAVPSSAAGHPSFLYKHNTSSNIHASVYTLDVDLLTLN